MSTAVRQRRPGFLRRLIDAVAKIEDGVIVRTAFFGMLIGTGTVLYIDYSELMDRDPGIVAAPVPILPIDPDGDGPMTGPQVTTDPKLLEDALTVALQPGGVLALTGTIDPDAATRVEAQLEALGEYIKVVRLDSPGGSVDDAIKIGEMIRAHGFDTLVETGALCASSCPLVFAGGVHRTAEAGAAVGIHQVFASAAPDQKQTGARAAGDAMAQAQRTTARITRYLTDMGVDTALWLHALDTPPASLYYLSAEEMQTYRLVTPAEVALLIPAVQQ